MLDTKLSTNQHKEEAKWSICFYKGTHDIGNGQIELSKACAMARNLVFSWRFRLHLQLSASACLALMGCERLSPGCTIHVLHTSVELSVVTLFAKAV